MSVLIENIKLKELFNFIIHWEWLLSLVFLLFIWTDDFCFYFYSLIKLLHMRAMKWNSKNWSPNSLLIFLISHHKKIILHNFTISSAIWRSISHNRVITFPSRGRVEKNAENSVRQRKVHYSQTRGFSLFFSFSLHA